MQEQSPQFLRIELEITLLKMQQAHMLKRERYLVYRMNRRPFEPTASYVTNHVIVGISLIVYAIFLLNVELWSTEPRLPSREIVLLAILLIGLGLFIPFMARQKFKEYRDFAERYESQRQRVIERYENRIKEVSGD